MNAEFAKHCFSRMENFLVHQKFTTKKNRLVMGNTSNIKQLVLLDFEQRVGLFPEKKDGEPNHNDGPLKLPEHNASQSAKVRNNKFFVELR